jgi:hypothetical protein
MNINLQQSVFTYGELYIALSRITDIHNLDIFLPEKGDGRVENIINSEILLR